MNHRGQFHGGGRVLYKGGLCLYLSLIGLLLWAPLGLGQSRGAPLPGYMPPPTPAVTTRSSGASQGATIPELEAERRKLGPRLVQLRKEINRLEVETVEASIKARAGGPDAQHQDLVARTAASKQANLQKEADKIGQQYTQLELATNRISAAEPPPSSIDEARARNVANQNTMKHTLNLLMKLEAQALDQAQLFKKLGYTQGYIEWLKKKDALTAQIVKYKDSLDASADYEKTLRQMEGTKGDPNKMLYEELHKLGDQLMKQPPTSRGGRIQ
jgi:hypothetical protein